MRSRSLRASALKSLLAACVVAACVVAPSGCSLFATPCDDDSACPEDAFCAAGGICADGKGHQLADAGFPADAGHVSDAGQALDAGSRSDAGFAAVDAGFTADDAGSTADDAGFTADDAGFTADDAGFTAGDAGFAADDDAGEVDDSGYIDFEPNLDAGEPGFPDGGIFEQVACVDVGQPCTTDCGNFLWGPIDDDALGCLRMIPGPVTGVCSDTNICVLDPTGVAACSDVGAGELLASCDGTCGKAPANEVCPPGATIPPNFGIGDLCALSATSVRCDGDRCIEDEGLGFTSSFSCDVRGTCRLVATGTCGAYHCADDVSCLTTCATPDDCVGGAPCSNDGGDLGVCSTE